MLLNSNIIYGEKSGLILSYSNETEKEYFEKYIQKVESERIPNVCCDYNWRNLNRTLPSSGGINLTDDCQLRCNYCAFSSGEGEKKTLTFDDVKAFINFLFKNAQLKGILCDVDPNVRISFAGGGEPTFKWDLFKEITKYIKHISQIKKIKVHLTLTTNGILNSHQLEYISEIFDSIMVSYDGICNVQNENRLKKNNRGRTSEYVENTIETLLNQGAHVIIRTTVWPHQYNNLKCMRDNIFGKFDRIKSWEISPVNYVGRARENGANSHFTNAFYEHYYDLKQNSELDVCRRILSSWFGRYERSYFCGASFGSYPWLNADGRIISCLDTRDCGNELGYIYKGEIVACDFCDLISNNHINSLENRCYSCVAYLHCGGGCPLKNRDAVNLGEVETYYSDIECYNKKQYWKMVIEQSMQGNVLNDMELKAVDVIDGKEIYKLVIKGDTNDKY